MLSFIKSIDKHKKTIIVFLSIFYITFSFINIFYPQVFRIVSLFYFLPVILYSLINRKLGVLSAFISIILVLFITTYYKGVVIDQPIFIFNLGGGAGLLMAAWTFGTLRDLLFDGMRKEEIIINSREKYKKVVDNIREGMIIVDNDGFVRFLNKACASILGIEVTDIDFDVKNLLNEENRRKLSEELEIRKQGRSSDYFLEYDNPLRGKRKIFVAATPFTDQYGTINGSIGFLSDVTDSEEKTAQIKTLKLRNEYLFSEMQHRVGNGLAMMKAFLNLYLSAKNVNGKDGLEKIDNIFDTIASINTRYFQNFHNQTVFIIIYLKEIVLNFIHKYRCKLKPTVTGSENIELHIDMALPLGMLVTILLTNIIKKAITKNAEGNLLIFANKNNNIINIKICLDDMNMKNKTILYNKKSIENEIVDALLVQIKGTILINRKINTITISF